MKRIVFVLALLLGCWAGAAHATIPGPAICPGSSSLCGPLIPIGGGSGPAIVQQVTGTCSASPCVTTIAATAAGDLITAVGLQCSTVGCGFNGVSYTITAADTNGDTCSEITAASTATSNIGSQVSFDCPNITSGNTTVTLTYSLTPGTTPFYVLVKEWSGAATSSPIEAASSNYATSSPVSCTSGSTSVANDAVYTVGYAFTGGSQAISGGSWTALPSTNDWYQIGAATTTYPATFTWSGGSPITYPCIIFAIKP